MKKLLLTISLLLSLLSAKSQGYESIFGNTSTVWNISEQPLDGTQWTHPYSVGDTVTHQGKLYRKVLKYGSDTYHAVREDTATGRIWDFFSGTEILVVDMSMQVGDSININSDPASTDQFVMVDSVYSKNNRKHIRLAKWIDYQQNKKLEFIEGIGPNTGILYKTNEWLVYNELLICAYKDGNQVFADSSLFISGPCEYNVMGIEDIKPEIKVSVSPNPANDHFTINVEVDTTGEIIITDALGCVVFNSQTTAQKTKVSTQNWPAGLYFYTVDSIGKKAVTGKLMVVR